MSLVTNSPGFPIYATGSAEAPRALIVLQEAFGVNNHIRAVADNYADDGFFVVAPHLFHRSGSPEIPYDDIDQAITVMSTVTESGLTNDLRATTDFLATLGFNPESIGIVGFCMGGSVALFAATLGIVGAAVSFYGGGIAAGRMGFAPLLEVAEQLHSPWLGLYGDLDTGIPVAEVEALRDVTERLDVVTEIVRYPLAGHGFHCDARPAAYNDDATMDADTRVREFFDAHLSPILR